MSLGTRSKRNTEGSCLARRGGVFLRVFGVNATLINRPSTLSPFLGRRSPNLGCNRIHCALLIADS